MMDRNKCIFCKEWFDTKNPKRKYCYKIGCKIKFSYLILARKGYDPRAYYDELISRGAEETCYRCNCNYKPHNVREFVLKICPACFKPEKNLNASHKRIIDPCTEKECEICNHKYKPTYWAASSINLCPECNKNLTKEKDDWIIDQIMNNTREFLDQLTPTDKIPIEIRIPAYNIPSNIKKNLTTSKSAGSKHYNTETKYYKRLEKIWLQYPNAYSRWTPEDDAEMSKLLSDGKTTIELSARFKRHPSAIASRLNKLGLREERIYDYCVRTEKSDKQKRMDQINKQYPNDYLHWRPEEDTELSKLFSEGKKTSELSANLKRYPGAIR